MSTDNNEVKGLKGMGSAVEDPFLLWLDEQIKYINGMQDNQPDRLWNGQLISLKKVRKKYLSLKQQ